MIGRGILFVILLALGLAGSASATTPRIIGLDRPVCHAVTPVSAHDSIPDAAAFGCTGEPAGYQHQMLWLQADLTAPGADPGAQTLLIHHSRFDRLIVAFAYADGVVRRSEVRRGAFGSRWRIGGQIAFEAPDRSAALVGLTIGFERLASHGLLRARLMPSRIADVAGSLAAAFIGGALTLLLVGALYNLALAHAVRRPFIAWHGAWAACLLLWGMLWSQLALVIAPGVAGTLASQMCTALATLAVACATASAITSLEPGMLPTRVRHGVLALGGAVALVGLYAAMALDGSVDWLGAVLGVLILADLAAVAACITLAWRRGSVEARDFALAWAPPMATLALTQFFDMSNLLFGGGSQIAILIASALQTVWLSIAVTRRLAKLRAERDAARAAQIELDMLARRDSLTGLLNRRGFIPIASAALREAEQGGPALGLLLIDVDHFKAVNDRFGHDVGDAVLQRIAGRLRQWEGEICTAGRLGGEEFILCVRGLAIRPLAEFADRVRIGIAETDYTDLLGEDGGVTVSIGITDAGAAATFQGLYRVADQALYEAKRAGRNRIALPPADRPSSAIAVA